MNCGENPKLGTLPLSVSLLIRTALITYLKKNTIYIYLYFTLQFEQPVFGSFDENFISYASTAILCL